MMRRHRHTAWAAVGIALACAASTGSFASAASSTSTVSVTVASATNLDASACASGTANVTDMGTLLPNQSSVTSSDCTLTFGSSNDSSQLRVAQSDTYGVGMFSASKGTLDTSFNATGTVTTNMGTGHSVGTAGVIQPDGKILMTGSCSNGADDDFCLLRYTTAGALDTTFNTTGKVQTAIGSAADQSLDMVLQPDGKIIAAGRCSNGADLDYCVVRYTAAGALDTTFNTTGKLTFAMGSADDVITGIALQTDGKIIVAGTCWGATIDFCIARLTPTGDFDTTFNATGKLNQAVGTGNDMAEGVIVQADGNILVSGGCNNGTVDFCSIRLTPAGALDTTWNATGKLMTAVGAGTDNGVGVTQQPDGKILHSGSCSNGANLDFCMVRYSTTGALDATFNATGKVTTPIGTGDDSATTPFLQPDGKIVLGGKCIVGGNFSFCDARYTTAGALDTTFNGTGYITIAISGGANNGAAPIVQPDGRIVQVGQCHVGWDNFCALELAATGTFADYANATTDWDQGANMFGACLRAVAGGASAQWTASATCPTTDGAYWNAIPTTAAKIAYAASAGTTAATASMRFGVRTATSQPPGVYTAPVTFDVLAPNA